MPDVKGTGERGKAEGGAGGGAGLGGAEFAGIGLQFALGILVFTALGGWLDRRIGTAPWLLVTGVFLGAGGGFYSMYRKITAAQRRDAEARTARAAGKGS